MGLMSISWLEWAILWTFLGALWSSSASSLAISRHRAFIGSALALVFCLAAWWDMYSQGPFAAQQGFQLLSHLGPGFFALDALNTPLLALSALICLVIIAVTLKTRSNRFSFSRTLLLEAFLLLTLSAQNPWWLIVCLAFVVIPQAHELKARGRFARVFGIHMMVSLGLMLAGQTMLSFNPSESTQFLAYSLLAAGIAIRAGLIPAHCWVIDLFENASFGGALLTVSPLLAVYACARLVIPGAPALVLSCLAALALITALYTAAMATVQIDARRFICYFLLSQSSWVIAGISLASPLGMTSGWFLWLASPLSGLGLALSLRALEARTGRLQLTHFLGLHAQTPTLAALFLVTGLAAVGFPGTLGFFGLEMLTDAATQFNKFFGFLVVASGALNGIAVLRVYALVFLGGKYKSSANLRIRRVELVAFLSLILLLMGGTLWPQVAIDASLQVNQILRQ